MGTPTEKSTYKNEKQFKKQTNMALQTLNTIKEWFKTGLKPSQTQFWDTWDSFRHKNDKVPVTEVEGLDEIIDSKADKMILDNHLTDDAAHADLFNDKEDKTQKGAPDGYAPLDEFTKLAAQYLNIVNDLVTGGAESLLSAEQGKVLQMQVNAINNLLTSDNVNLDTLQELVDAVETVQASLSTILVNDLTTGGMTKALTAEMGKKLDAVKVDKSESDYLSIVPDENGFVTGIASTKSTFVISAAPNGAFLTSISFANGFQPYNGKIFTLINKLNEPLALEGPAMPSSGYVRVQGIESGTHEVKKGVTISFVYDSSNISDPVLRQIGVPVLESFAAKANKETVVDTHASIAVTLNANYFSRNKCVLFTNANPIVLTVPTNALEPLPIGSELDFVQQGDGTVTVGGAGITFVTNLSLSSVKGETRRLRKIAIDTWTVEGNALNDSQIEIGANAIVNYSWNGKTILFTANCTITVPATLLSQYGFVFRTLAGVTVTWAITAPFTWETTPSTTPEKTTGSLMRRGNTNTILLDF